MLAQGVDRRVRDLGEQLVEVVEEGAVARGQAGQRGVHAHRRQRGRAALGHGADHLVHVVPVVAELRHAQRQRDAGIGQGGGLRGGVEVGHVERLVGDPVAVGLLLGEGGADLVVVDHAPLREVDLQHLAGAEAPGREDVLGLDVDRAHLARQQEAVVARHVVARRAQAVAVEGGAQRPAVGEGDGRRAVPGLHEHRLVGVVSAPRLRQGVVVVPGLGDEQGDRARHRPPVHDQELEHVVEDRGVGALAVDDGHDALEVGAEHRRVEVGLAGADPVDVALQGVDLAVVDDVAVGMGALPAGRGVGGVARVDERHGGRHGGVVQVDEEAAHLGGDEHALVHDGARGHGAHVEDLARKRALRVGALLDGAAADVQAALEGVARLRVVGAP